MVRQFLGEHDVNLDDRGRIAIPARFREKLGETVIVTMGWDPCLAVFPLPVWEGMISSMADLTLTDQETREGNRFLFTKAVDCEIDKQGRILIPANLRQYAHLTDTVVVAGVGAYLEIWDRATYQAESERLAQRAAIIARNLSERGARLIARFPAPAAGPHQ